MKIQHILLVSIALFLLQSCQEDTQTPTVDVSNIDISTIDWQAHRGGKGLAPENTVPAFTYAITLPNVKTLELDVVVSKDSQLVVSHEPWMSANICLKPDGVEISEAEEKSLNLFEMTYEEIKSYDCGSKPVEGYPDQKKMKTWKPTLESVVKSVNAYAAQRELTAPKFNIEIKTAPEGDNVYHPVPEAFATLLLAEIKKLRIKKRTTIQSFDVRALQAVHQQDSTFTLAYLLGDSNGLEKDLEVLGFTPQILSPNHNLVTNKMVSQAHELGMKVIPWTVNEVARMKTLLGLDVDGIITDYPDRIALLEMELQQVGEAQTPEE